MGGSQSVERVTISREDEAFNIIRVSEDTIRTLRGERQNATTATLTPVEKAKMVVLDEKLQSALNDERQLTQRLRQDLQRGQQQIQELQKKLASLERDAKDATFTVPSMDKMKPDVDRMKQAESFYRQKLDELLDRERRRQQEATALFKESLDRLQQRFLKYSCHTACAEVESKVLQCYLANPRQPMQCSRQGDEFMQCVDEYRAKLLTAKEMRIGAN